MKIILFKNVILLANYNANGNAILLIIRIKINRNNEPCIINSTY